MPATAAPARPAPAPPTTRATRAAQAAVALTALGGAALLASRPVAALGLPRCPVAAHLHLDCPGCGTTRALSALLRGDLTSAVDHNVFAVAALPVLVVAFVCWLAPRRKPAWVQRLAASPLVPKLVLVAVIAFTLLRNTPLLGGYLGSTAA